MRGYGGMLGKGAMVKAAFDGAGRWNCTITVWDLYNWMRRKMSIFRQKKRFVQFAP
jgi:hypothetical protein